MLPVAIRHRSGPRVYGLSLGHYYTSALRSLKAVLASLEKEGV